jgi:prepilin-type N-terminal cleavage/methylation domain-containing protein
MNHVSHRTAVASRFRAAVMRPGGFTLVEVMIASIVLVLGITTSITTLQHGFRAVDTARNYTFASQVMQSEFERLRLKSWSQLEDLQNSGNTAVSFNAVSGMATGSFRCVRTIRDLKTDMKEITLVSTWRGVDGREHSARYVTRYGKSGLYDYFYTSH